MSTKKFLSLILSISAIVAGTIFIVANIENDVAIASTSTPAHAALSLNGHWTQSKSGIPGAVMTADISNGTIRIDVDMSNSVSGLYWAGSFDTGSDNLSPFSVTSVGDTKAMDEAMFGSQDLSKVFYYNNGVLSFPFSMMGVSTTVELSRS